MKSTLCLILMLASLPFGAQAASSSVILEWAPFKVAKGVTQEQLIQASEQMQTHFLNAQKGYLKRELLHEEGRQWIDLIYWASEADAKNALKSAQKSEACGLYFSLMDGVDQSDSAAGIKHYHQIGSWKK